MQVKVKNKDIFPSRVWELLQALYSAGFFEECMLIGSWVMPIYKETFGINYSLRTLDIDFAIKIVYSDKDKKIDIDKIITDLGYLPVIMQSGIRKFTHENFTIEFIVQRRGGKDDEVVSINKWNIVAAPLPFVDILLAFPFTADFEDFKVRAPLPEAFFIQKLITASRRRDGSKKDKDLEQCAVIARHLNPDRLREVVNSFLTIMPLKTRLQSVSKPTTNCFLNSALYDIISSIIWYLSETALLTDSLCGLGTLKEYKMKVEIEREEDGRWMAEVSELAGVLTYGKTREEAIAKVEALALRVIADRLDHGESIPELDELFALPA